MPFEQEMAMPSATSITEKTIEELPNDVDFPGEYTDRLSELSKDEDERLLYRPSKAYFATWHKRLRPLVRNNNVKAFSITNLLLFFINIILLSAVISLFIYALVQFIMASKASSQQVPCLYQWSKWGECSDMCAMNSSHLPTKTRKVLSDTIVRARGKYKKSAPCPENLSTLEDTAPCNTHVCAKNLSQFGWRMDKSGEKEANYYVDVENIKKGCYKIRDVPTKDQLVRIDTTDLIAEVECDGPINRPVFVERTV